ncbi:hypothetical protein EVAR_17235_1 [Eumeta japonica]|uniref:Secreted protein n=1 Tax=Eumeta variegata TaxID=151549 RepID=A0A4C1U949_EUMVA|nr:hypothetical protein EVAR_17235_1 [Eumeta japonica]
MRRNDSSKGWYGSVCFVLYLAGALPCPPIAILVDIENEELVICSVFTQVKPWGKALLIQCRYFRAVVVQCLDFQCPFLPTTVTNIKSSATKYVRISKFPKLPMRTWKVPTGSSAQRPRSTILFLGTISCIVLQKGFH